MFRRLAGLAIASLALVVASGPLAAPAPTVAQIKAAIATHPDDFILANRYGSGGHASGRGWIDVKTGAGRWVYANGKRVSLVSVRPEPHQPSRVIVTDIEIDYLTRTWSRTTREESATRARPRIVDPLDATSAGVRFEPVGIENVDGRKTYHLRSTTYSTRAAGDNVFARSDVWFSTDRDYLIRYTHTTRDGKVISRIDNHWLPRTAANLALLTSRIPRGFRQVFLSP